MYSEKHPLQHRYTIWLQWTSAVIALWQIGAFLGAETGLSWLPLGYMVHLAALVLALGTLVLLYNAGLSLRVSNKGWALRIRPLQLYYRQISWGDIRNVRLLKPGELPQKSKHGFAQSFMLSNPSYEVFCIELKSGYQVFLSVQQPDELLDFLHNRLLQPDLKKKVLA